jgi:hypothetical protein
MTPDVAADKPAPDPSPAPAAAPPPPPPPVPAPALQFLMRHGVAAALVCQALLLLVAGWRNRDLLNTDAIAYLRIASYYANGQSDLMVSGYWGPLLSWLMVPWLKFGCAPLIAARLTMAVSALVFSAGCASLFRALELPAAHRILGTWLAAVASVFWSVRYITPDLLLGGLMALAIAGVVNRRWIEDCESALQTGLLWGLAFLAKAVAFPLAFAVLIGFAETWRLSGVPRRKIAKSLAWTLIPFFIITIPWIVTLSVKYQKFTFSTSGRINHAIAGPPDMDRYHPFSRTIRQPEPGRVTSWEDPSPLSYRYWSPFASPQYALYQLRIIAGNAPVIFHLLGGVNPAQLVLRLREGLTPNDAVRIMPGFDLLYLGLIGLFAGLVGWRSHLAQERWRWVIVPAVLGAGIYLPVFLLPDDQRYFYPLFPLLWAAASGAFHRWVTNLKKAGSAFERTGWRIVTASFALPALFWLLVALVGMPNPANDCARELATRLQAAKLTGPVAGSGLLPGGRAGLFLAYYTSQPWYGDLVSPNPAGFRASRAKLIVVRRGLPLQEALETDPAFQNLDRRLFTKREEAEDFPLVVYELKALPQ